MSTTKTKYHGLLSPYLRNRRLAMARPLLTGRVLDVGCAEGHLAESVPADRYVGVDWLRRWAGMLESGGQIVLTTPYDRYEPLHGIAAKLRLTSDEAHDEHETCFDRESLEAAFEAAGLKPSSYKRFLLGLNQLAVATR